MTLLEFITIGNIIFMAMLGLPWLKMAMVDRKNKRKEKK